MIQEENYILYVEWCLSIDPINAILKYVNQWDQKRILCLWNKSQIEKDEMCSFTEVGLILVEDALLNQVQAHLYIKIVCKMPFWWYFAKMTMETYTKIP
jgi:hypothetical protein